MFIGVEMDEILSRRLKPFTEPGRRSCDGCEKEKGRDVCAKCIQTYLDYRQTLENIRRM